MAQSVQYQELFWDKAFKNQKVPSKPRQVGHHSYKPPMAMARAKSLNLCTCFSHKGIHPSQLQALVRENADLLPSPYSS